MQHAVFSLHKISLSEKAAILESTNHFADTYVLACAIKL